MGQTPTQFADEAQVRLEKALIGCADELVRVFSDKSTDDERRAGMQADVLAMMERAGYRLGKQWVSGAEQPLALQLHYYECRAFAAELAERT